MSTYSDLLSHLKSRLDLVPQIGVTHAYQRYAADWEKYLVHFKTTIDRQDQIRGWVLTLNDRDPIAVERFGLNTIKRTYSFLLYGVLGLQDAGATEATFLDLVEAIMDKLEGRLDLGVTGTYMVEPVQMRLYQIRQFGSVLCHYGEIVIPVQFDKAITYETG